MASTPEKTRTAHDHFLVRTVTYRIPVDRSDPESVAGAYELLAKLPPPADPVIIPATCVEVSKPKFWNRPKAE